MNPKIAWLRRVLNSQNSILTPKKSSLTSGFLKIPPPPDLSLLHPAYLLTNFAQDHPDILTLRGGR